jgi:hypothetical protein
MMDTELRELRCWIDAPETAATATSVVEGRRRGRARVQERSPASLAARSSARTFTEPDLSCRGHGRSVSMPPAQISRCEDAAHP